MKMLVVRPARSLHGRVRVSGDKSISHRALIFSAMARGTTVIKGLSTAQDVGRTRGILEQLGVRIRDRGGTQGEGLIEVEGRGGELDPPRDILDCGNSGTTMRLMMGLLAGQPFTARLTGDPSLGKRPMDRVMQPLEAMGARLRIQNDARYGRVIEVCGRRPLKGIAYRSPVPSAQVKSAILIAGRFAKGATSVSEPSPSRDHTERMQNIWKDGRAPLEPVGIPGDFSSAAFIMAAGLTVRNSSLEILGVGINPTRTGFLDVLRDWGARVTVVPEERLGVEPIGTLEIASSDLRPIGGGLEIKGDRLPRLIDEIPLIGLLASIAHGLTQVRDAGELRVKESDRISALVTELTRMGARVWERPDGFDIVGGTPRASGCFQSYGDHRMAMTLAVAGLGLSGTTVVQDTSCIETSFPEFNACLRGLGADVREIGG